jgi:ADP-heptose:LPS heptosyltransferase
LSKKALVIRWGAYGDLLYALPYFEAVKKEYGHLQLETGTRGEELLKHNPTFDKITAFDSAKYPQDQQLAVAEIRWNTLMDAYPWDYSVNLWRTLEVECIPEEWQPEYFWPRERRRDHFGKNVFTENPFLRGGLPIPEPYSMGTHYFPHEIGYWMPHWKKENKDNFIVAFAVAGSTCQKVPVGFKDLAKRIIDRYPETKIYLLGSGSGWMNIKAADLQFSFGEKNVAQLVDQTPYHRALALVKMADYVIGPETSLLVSAGMFGTPKTMICTSCSVAQATAHNANDFSIQSDAPCSPCHRAIYHDKFCVTKETTLGILPACNTMYDAEKILAGVDFAYSIRKQRAEVEVIDGGNAFSSLPQFKTKE